MSPLLVPLKLQNTNGHNAMEPEMTAHSDFILLRNPLTPLIGVNGAINLKTVFLRALQTSRRFECDVQLNLTSSFKVKKDKIYATISGGKHKFDPPVIKEIVPTIDGSSWLPKTFKLHNMF